MDGYSTLSIILILQDEQLVLLWQMEVCLQIVDENERSEKE